jgi:ATP-binding cassette subfamily G (WHITE) protein 2 (SNQ2)
MFDKVCLIYEGRMVYFGPADRARQYFIDMGYVPANRQTTPDFLVSVTDPNGRTAADEPQGASGSNSRPIPRNALEFEAYYRDSEIRKINLEDIQSYKSEFVDKENLVQSYKESARQEKARHTRIKASS